MIDTSKKEDFEGGFSSITNINSEHEERFLIEMFTHITSRLKVKYQYSNEEFLNLCYENEKVLVPAYIFSGNLSPAEAITKFLKENCQLSYSELSGMIGRDERSAWANYKRAAKKMPWSFEKKDGLKVPVSAFRPELSILEGLVFYLRNAKKMRGSKVAKLLNKSPSNIWTIYKRATKKNGKK